MPTIRSVLVFGVTGPQGRGAIEAFACASSLSVEYRLLAVTRDPSAPSAQDLLQFKGVHLVKSGFDDLEALFSAEPLWGIFLVQNAFAGDEVADGIKAIDLAVRYRVERFVYTSVDFEGVNPTPVPYFETKRAIENCLRSLSSPRFAWTILRPTRIMDNWLRPDYLPGMMAEYDPSVKYALISAADIGRVARETMERAEDYGGKSVELAGDKKSVREIADIWEKVRGQKLEIVSPENVPEAFVKTMKFNAEHPFLADEGRCREMFPWLLNFETWVKKLQDKDGKLQVVL